MRERRRKEYKKIIHSRQWIALSRAYKAAHPLCEECLKKGIVDSPATEVHHIRPIGSGADFGEMKALAFDEGNLEALCHDCHVAAHKRIRSDRLRVNRNEDGKADDPALSAFLKDFGL